MIKQLRIDNFKSLKGIDIQLGPMIFIVGPNASGKSNFAEALDFISHAVREDLAYAVAEKGGFYSICHRRQRRARGAISFFVRGLTKSKNGRETIDFTLEFQLKATGEDIRADFYVASESLTMNVTGADGSPESFQVIIKRSGNRYALEESSGLSSEERRSKIYSRLDTLRNILGQRLAPIDQQLLVSGVLRNFWPISAVAKELRSIRVFQLNPRTAREPAAPSVHGDLGRRGENLASALDRMRLNDPDCFAKLSTWLKDVVPTVGKLLTDYTETRQLGLFFQEEGFAARWFSEDMSDGTIMSVALFFALLDSRHGNILIEEPETSLHPWILRKFLERCREQSKQSQIIITTHSPLAIAQARPEELYLIERAHGISTLKSALQVEASLPQIIRQDILNLGDYWLSGGLGAVPQAPDADASDLFGTNANDSST